MDIEQFLSAQQPFRRLSPELLRPLAGRFESRTIAEGARFLAGDDGFFVVVDGSVELLDTEGEALNHIGPRDMFGYRRLLYDDRSVHDAEATEAVTVLRLDGRDFCRVCEEQPKLRAFFDAKRQKTTHAAAGKSDSSAVSLMATPLSDLIGRAPVALSPDTSIQDAASLMATENISSVLVVNGGALEGIVTDRDLRRKVVAAGLPGDGPIASIMTPDPITLESSTYAFEALLAMARQHIHHLPVMHGTKPVGMITATDLLESRSTSAVFMLADIYKRKTPAELAEISKQVPHILARLQSVRATADSIGHVISSIGEAISCRLLELGEAKLGPPPVPYTFLVAGSMARHEQTALSDQDNALLLSDDVKPEHDAYFLALMKFVSDGLDACGYEYCRGEIMGTTTKWRQPLVGWKGYFDRWIDEPEPMALMHSSIFFDMRAIYGETSLFDDLNRHVLGKSGKNSLFLSFMVSNALSLRPPLGVFRNFVRIRGGEHHKTLDLKHNGVVPIIDLARIYSLAGSVPAVNTLDRLDATAGGAVSRDGAADLKEAFSFISEVRLAHQAEAIRRGETPDNFVLPDDLSQFDRNHLKDSFAVVRSMQATIEQRYQAGRLR